MHYVLSDIHGRSDLLDNALIDIALRWEVGDQIIFLGDYVDRGPDSKGVVDRVKKLVEGGQSVALKGNHDNAFVKYLEGEHDGFHWFDHYAWATIPSYLPEWNFKAEDHDHSLIRSAVGDHKDFLESLHYIHVTEHHVFVHAGLMPGYSVYNQDDQTCMWIRDRFLSASERDREAWSGQHVVHGHTPVTFDPLYNGPRPPEKLGVNQLDWRTNVDTGACFKDGRLAMAVFDLTQPGGPKEVLYYE